MNKKAEMGIGTLIIFIAMILVAAIAAGVLIQTASTLQSKALLTGSRSTSQVSTSISPMLVYAEDGSTGNSVDNFNVKLKMAPGSDPVKFVDTLVEFSLKNASSDMIYNESEDCTTYPAVGEYGVRYLIQGANYATGYLQRGDVVSVCFTSPRAVGEDETVTISIIPKIGSATVITTALPDVITEQRITIFP